jgi:TrmH family RNA methyltransferase
MKSEAPAPLARLDSIVIVLSHTTEPGNIGATCRAMKTMGLHRLRLINPLNHRSRAARAMAHGAEDILQSAEIVPDLKTAIGDAHVVAGTTARRRQMRKDVLLPPEQLAARLLPLAASGTVCLLFGTERTGLTNEETDVCRYLSRIDTAYPQPSLNLAQAVMVYCWELRRACLTASRPKQREPQARRSAPAFGSLPEMKVHHPHRGTRLPTQLELDMMYTHLGKAMAALGYSDVEMRKFLTYLRQMHMRAGIVNWELQVYHLLARRILKITGQPAFDGAD